MSEENTLNDDQDTNQKIDGEKARRVDPGFKRNMKLLGGAFVVLVVLVVGVVFATGKKQEKAMGSTISLGASAGVPNDDGMTPDMKKKLEQMQMQEAAAAASKNQSYIPPDISSTPKPIQEAAPVIGNMTPSTMDASGTVPMRAAGSFDADGDQRRRDGLRRQLAALIDDQGSNEVREKIVFDKPTTVATPAQAASAAATAALAKKQFLPGLYIASAELASDLKIPEGGSGFASAKINAGPASGGFLIGTAKVVGGDALSIEFTQMKVGTNFYKVNAIVLDEKTASDAISGNVDSRPLQRYVFPVFLAAAQGFYAAQAQTASTTTINVNGVQTDRTAATFEQARAAGTAKGLEIVQQEVQKSAQKPLNVSREQRTTIGILFREPVFEEGQ